MENTTLEQLAAMVEEQKAEIAELRKGLDYAVYGIGSPHPDPREQGEPIKG